MKTFTGTVLLVCLLGRASVAAPTTLTFDILPEPRGGPVPNGYGGLSWSNFDYLDVAHYLPSGFDNAAVSPTNVAFNSGGQLAVISASRAFDLDSAYLTAVWNDGLTVALVGKNGSTVKYDQRFTVNTSGPTFFNFNYVGVTEVDFTSSGGQSNVNFAPYGAGTEFAMDNLTIELPSVPEPSFCRLICLGLVGLVGLQRRCTQGGCTLRARMRLPST